MRREPGILVRERVEDAKAPARPPPLRGGPELEIDAEFFDEPCDALEDLATDLAAIAADAGDGDSWQRLADVIGRITGEIDVE